MRVMVLVKANRETEAGVLPSHAELEAMGRFNEELVNAGVLLAADGLHPSSKGLRVRYGDGTRTVTDGPFTEAKELVAGYWIWQVRSLGEAVEWARRAPFAIGDEVEIRPVIEGDELGEGFTPDLRE